MLQQNLILSLIGKYIKLIPNSTHLQRELKISRMAHQGGTQGSGDGRGGSQAAWGRGGTARGNELGLRRSGSGRGDGLASAPSGAARGMPALPLGRGNEPARGRGHAGTLSASMSSLSLDNRPAAGALTPSVIMPRPQGRGQPAPLKGTAPAFQPGVPLGGIPVQPKPPSEQPAVTTTAPLPPPWTGCSFARF